MQLAPAAKALIMSPEYLIPPSEIMGILALLVTFAISNKAVNWGTPTPATTLVVQIDPGPIPTLIASAPNLIKSLAASGVAIFPTTIGVWIFFLICLKASKTNDEWPWAVSINKTSTPTLSRSIALLKSISFVPMAAPTNNWPFLSLTEWGNFSPLWISLTVIRPIHL